MAKVKDAGAFADKYVRNGKAAQGDYKAGIESVTEAPGKKAVENAQGYIDGVNASYEKWKKRTGDTTLEEWKKPALDKGVRNFSGGIEAARDKMLRYGSFILPRQKAAREELDRSAPRGNEVANEDRMLLWSRMMRKMGEEYRNSR